MSNCTNTQQQNQEKPSWVTRGTVQVELNTEPDAGIFLTPNQDFRIKPDKEEFIVFVDATVLNSPDASTPRSFEARVFKKTQRFNASDALSNQLTQAAFRRTNVEIRITIPDVKRSPEANPPAEATPPATFPVIVSVRIPATP
jgi:hypothetical protein